jgi:steroid 5-alpha reductase family enzyme
LRAVSAGKTIFIQADVMNPILIGAIAGSVIFILVTLMWLVSLKLKDAGIADIFWGSGFVVTAWVLFFLTQAEYTPRKWLLCALVSIWGLRLSWHILLRNRGRGEDFRYAAWRKSSGRDWWWRSYFKVFLLQGLLMWLISAPLFAAQFSPDPRRWTIADLLALPVWAVGFYFEAAGDRQLARFRSDPSNRGKVLSTGVWRYTRHPNYFGDALQWWGFFLAAASTPGGLWTLFSPVLMTLLLMRVSGVPMLEESLKRSKPGYAQYIRSTNSFFPWFPR